MKNLLLAFFTVGITFSAFGQDQTLFDRVSTYSLFGAPMLGTTNLDEHPAVIFGGGGGIVLDETFIGLFGQSTTSVDTYRRNGEDCNLNVSYGGFWLGYTYDTHRMIHPYLSYKNGWGTVGYLPIDGVGTSEITDFVYVMSPELGLEVNVLPFMRIALTGGYQRVAGLEDDFFLQTNKNLSSWTAGMTIRFSAFSTNEDFGL